MANTFASLDPSVVSAQAMIALKNKTAVLTQFSTDFSGEVKRGAVINVPLYTGGTVLSNPTNFAQSDSTSATVAVTPVHLVSPISLTYSEYNAFHSLETQIGAAVNKLVDKMQATVFAHLSTSNFSVGLSANPVGLTTANLATAWASVAGSEKICYLTSTGFGNFNGVNTQSFNTTAGGPAFGFDNFGWTDSIATAQSGVYGFVASGRNAFAVAAGLPEIQRPDEIDSFVIDLGNGLQAKITYFYDKGTRTEYMAAEAMFGASIAEAGSLKLTKW
jgi:hypothetical protein